MSPLSGNAGFRYTPAGGSIKTHRLAFPMELQMAPAHRKRRYISDSLDGSAHEVVSIAPGRAEVEATLRFGRNSQDLLDMLEHAADGLVLTYYPDLSVNTSYALWLVSSGDEVALAQDGGRYGFGEYEVRVRFRDASASGTSLEALFSPWLFKYEAGMAVPGAVFTRTGTARQIGQFGVLESVATGLPRDGHWPLADGVRTLALVLGPTRTNLVTSDDVSAWTDSGTPVVTGSVQDPAGGTGAYNVADDDAGVIEAKRRAVTFTGDGTKGYLFVVRQGTMPASGVQKLRGVRDLTAPADRGALDISGWVNGEPTVTAAVGNYLGKQALGNGYWILYGQATGVVAANSNVVDVVPAFTAAETGSIDVYRANAFNDAVPPSMPLDASGVLGAETFYTPFTHAPQAMTVYVRFIERGNPSDGTNPRVMEIGNAAGGDPRFLIYRGATGYTAGHDPAALVTSVVTSATPAYGDLVELSATLSASGSVQLSQSINGGAVVTGAASAAATLGASWAGTRYYINSTGAGSRGLADHIAHKVASGSKALTEMRAL